MIVGTSTFADLTQQAFRWTTNDGMQDLGAPLGSWGSAGYGVSGDGALVVGQAFHAPESGGTQGFLSNVTEKMMPIPSGESHPLAISADGITVAGYRAVGTPFVWIAFRWTAQAGVQDLGLLPGACQSLAESISADGTAIAGSCVFPDDPVWRPDRQPEQKPQTCRNAGLGC